MSVNQPTDAVATLGTILESDLGRDAVHVAVVAAVAGEWLDPGQHVGFRNGTAGMRVKSERVGIVDPFLTDRIGPGQRFWLFLYPRTITGLRHVWTHPDFEAEDAPAAPPSDSDSARVASSKQWLTEFANGLGVTYDNLIRHASIYLSTGDYWVGGSDFEGAYAGDEFWDHYQNATGAIVPSDDRSSFFSCGC